MSSEQKCLCQTNKAGCSVSLKRICLNEPGHDQNQQSVRKLKTQISLGTSSVWS